MSWTTERVDLMRQMWATGISASKIAAALGAGVSRNAVIGKVHRLGIVDRSAATGVVAPRMRRKETASVEVGVVEVKLRASGGGGAAIFVETAQETGEPRAAAVRLPEAVVVPMSLRVTIVDLKESMCKWPLGDPTSPDFRYCGSAARASGPYCAHHAKMAYQPPQDRRRDRRA